MSKQTKERKPTKKATIKKAEKPKSPVVDTNEKLWQEMYVISEHWKSDLAFFKDELTFLKKLVDKYFKWLVKNTNIERTRKVASDLLEFESRKSVIWQKVNSHCDQLANIIENPFSQNTQECKDDHTELEIILAGFTKDFRQVKKEVFDLTEAVIESENAKHLLNEGL